MSARTIQLLHVEDSPVERRFMAHHLSGMPDFKFDIRFAESEAAAVTEFEGGGIDCVILDYNLAEGNGLSCLRKIRERDRIVPIIAVSGLATEEIAAELIEAGADDYITKQDLTAALIAASLRIALVRADAVRQHGQVERRR